MTMIGSEYHPDQFQSHTMTVPEVRPATRPAAEDKDLEEAHADAVVSQDEPDPDGLEPWERKIYSDFSPGEIKEIIGDWSRLVQENQALRKGMKTMQRKSRKQNQVQRRLERRLNQARAGREKLRANDATLSKFADSLRELAEGAGRLVREGE
jgi:type I site-specific restriction-modification system R (restriction) subunit